MGFVQPWMLAFGLVGLVPLVLHLIGRQRARVVQFSALAFLLAADPKRARALRIEQRLLVALRMAIAALIALALAQPLLPTWGADDGLVLGAEPVSVVLVIDNSLSMGVVRDGETRLARARRRATKLLATLPPGSRAAVVTSGRPARLRHARLSADLRSVAADVARVPATSRSDDAVRALRLARGLLANTPAPDRRVVVWSDLQRGPAGRGGWQDADLRGAGITVVHIGQAADDVAVLAAKVEPALGRGPQHARIRVTVARTGKNHAKSTLWRGQLRLRVGARESRTQLELAPGARLEHVFEVPALADLAEVSITEEPPPPVAGSASSAVAQPVDRQPGNNRRWVRLGGGETLRVLLIDGAPQPVARRDEVFFFVQALRAGVQRSDELRIEVRRPDQLLADALPNWDVLVLANVAELSGAQAEAIRHHVAAGAGLLITLGDAVPTEPTPWLTRLLPVALARTDSRGSHRLLAVDAVAGEAMTRLRRRLRDDAVAGLVASRVRRRRLLQPDARLGDWTALRYDDGAPAFVVAPLGKGRVAIWTTSIDRDWTDVPMHPGWLPLARQLVLAAAGRTGAVERLDVDVGRPVVLSRAAAATHLDVRFGDGVAQRLVARDEPAGLWRIAELASPGVWTLQEHRASGPLSRTLIVRPPASENAPALLSAPSATPAVSGGVGQRPLAPGWSFALVGLFVLLLAEAALLRRGLGVRHVLFPL